MFSLTWVIVLSLKKNVFSVNFHYQRKVAAFNQFQKKKKTFLCKTIPSPFSQFLSQVRWRVRCLVYLVLIYLSVSLQVLKAYKLQNQCKLYCDFNKVWKVYVFNFVLLGSSFIPWWHERWICGVGVSRATQYLDTYGDTKRGSIDEHKHDVHA